jgi:FemAB family protein
MKIIDVNNSSFPSFWQILYNNSTYQYPLYQQHNIEFYKALSLQPNCVNCSFIVGDDERPILGVMGFLTGNNSEGSKLSVMDLPLLFLENQCIERSIYQKSIKLLKDEIESLIQSSNVKSILYQDFLENGKLSFLGEFLLNKGATSIPLFTQIINLNLSEADIKRQIRKSYRSLINWGGKHFNIRILEKEDITHESIEQFRLLHIQAAGRETRSHNSWLSQYEMVRQGEAFVIFGELDSKLVTAALFPYSRKYCYYGVSASNRELFDKPLSHSIIWSAILHAKKRGCHFFETGAQYFPNQGNPSKKDQNISTFKHGFGGKTLLRLNILWQNDKNVF